eukprot:bmy_12195T0
MATITELSPTAGKSSQDVQGDEKLSPGKAPSLCSTRYGIAFITHLCNFIIMAQKVIMNITMVTMANSTNHQSQFNSSTEGLPVDSFDDPNNSPKSLPAGASVYDWSPQIQGIIFSSINYGMILTLAPSGYLAGRVGTKRVVGAALFGSSFLVLFTPLAADLGLGFLIATRILQGVSSSKQPLPIKAMVRSLPLWSLCFCCFSHQWLINSGFLSALPFIFAWVIGILGGYLADFLLTKNFRLVTVRKIASVLGSLPSSASLVVLPYVASSYITAVSLLTLSCGLSLFSQPGIYINALDIAPRHSSFLMGASRGFAQISAILAPTVSGFLLSQDPEFGWRNVFSLSFAINTLGLILYLIFGKADVQDWAKERKLTLTPPCMESH